VNTSSEARDVEIDGAMRGVLTGRTWEGKLHLAPLGVDLLQK
jgi:beta-galactosidase